MEKTRIVIGSPVRRRPDILAEFLQGLALLDGGECELSFRFIDDNDDPESSGLLRSFQELQSQKGISVKIEQADRIAGIPFVCNETTHGWSDALIWRVAEFKDRLIREAREREADALFLIDSDIVVHPRTALRLWECGKPIVSEVFWTQWRPGGPPLPQVWMCDEYEMVERMPGVPMPESERAALENEFIGRLRVPGLYRVGGLGACTLMRAEALRAGVSFRKIRNLSLWGEDRHFCIRAECLGLGLFVDTHLPAFHLYRSSDLPKLGAHRIHWRNMDAVDEAGRPNLVLSLIMRNEASNELREMLANCREFIDAASVIDDGSSDDSERVCREALTGIPVHIVRNETSRFVKEYELRQQQWMEATRLNPRWMLVLDADEWFEPAFLEGLPELLRQEQFDLYSFRIYDFWDSGNYREDEHWNGHALHRPLLVRYRPHFPNVWQESPLHCGRMPSNVFAMPNAISPYRLKHMGWSKESSRRAKYDHYRTVDPNGDFGRLAQYESILDPNPRLIEWNE